MRLGNNPLDGNYILRQNFKGLSVCEYTKYTKLYRMKMKHRNVKT